MQTYTMGGQPFFAFASPQATMIDGNANITCQQTVRTQLDSYVAFAFAFRLEWK